MLNTYIKNKGLTQTLFHNNNKNHFNEINWDTDYDGNTANISLTSNTDGHEKHFNIKLDNDDLATLLNVPSVSMPIDKRLETDFTRHTFSHNPNLLQIELPSKRVLHKKSKSIMSPESLMSPKSIISPETQSIEYYKPANYLSSPLSNEELIVPINIDEKSIDKFNFTPRRHHKQKKTHKTYKVYKKQRTSSKSKSKPKSKSKTKSNFTLF